MLCHNTETKSEQTREGRAQRARFVFSRQICEHHATRLPVYEVKRSKCACATQCQPRWVAGQGCQFALNYEKGNAKAPRCEKFVNLDALHSRRVCLFQRLKAGWIARAGALRVQGARWTDAPAETDAMAVMAVEFVIRQLSFLGK